MARRRMLVLAAVSAGVFSSAGAAFAQNPEPVNELRVKVAGIVELNELADAGIDVDHDVERVPDGIEAEVHVTKAQELQLLAMGAEIVDEGEEFAWNFATSKTLMSDALPRPAAPTVRVVRADYFSTKGQGFLYVEARTTQGAQTNPVITMQLENNTGDRTPFGSPRTMSRFVDSGVYMFHRNLFKVDKDHKPTEIRVTSSTGGQAIGKVSQWLDENAVPLTETPGYQYDFVDGYKHPQQLYARMEQIAAEYPEIAEMVPLPNKTNGYQRKAQAIIGSTSGTAAQAAVVVSSTEWGHEGGNGITVEMVDRPGANLPLEVEADGKAVRVLLAKNASGALASTAAQVADAIEQSVPQLINRAHPYRTNAGTGIVQPTATPIVLTDFLDQKRNGAPAGEVPRGPYTIRALRIGKYRDGSKPGVLIQAADHAREWVPMTITLETAERLVRNYATDAATRDIVDNTDVFLIPSNNPDGANYSFYNSNNQRRNMTNHCPDAQADPNYRNNWGVDLNRNYRFASGFDGYSGGSTNCTSDTFQGPAKLSEPETKNSIWLAETFRNIKFMMSVHSNGGQLFWQPGAYIANGRITAPRPPMGHESFYWQSADRILSQVRATARETVVTPENVGGSADVLYSSSGNVREDMYNNYGIFAFGWEVGGSVYNPNTGNFQNGSFQPPWDGDINLISGHGETLEYANGIIEMFRIAADWGRDKTPATTTLTPDTRQSDSPIGVKFDFSEPATIYYTTDGSRPTLESPRYKQTEFREGPEELWVEQTTTFKWFSVDAAGNVEPAGYDPSNPATADNYRSETIKIGQDGSVGGTVPATLSLTLGTAASFGPFTPGVAKEYEAATTANVISSAGDASLTVSDPGHLTNGSFSLPEPLRVEFSKSSWDAPVANDNVDITFKQAIKADDPLRTGTYSKTLTFTLSTTTP